MKNLTDEDIAKMIGVKFSPDDSATKNQVRRELHLAIRIPKKTEIPEHVTLDLHMHTIEQSWNEIMEIATSGARSATIITGASGILKIKFQDWVRDSLLTPYIISCAPLNNGSFSVRFRKLAL